MKQKSNPFPFKKNTDVEALPHAVVKTCHNDSSVKSKAGRKPSSEVGVRQKQVSAYLAQSEWEIFERTLDGRPASAVLRKLIMDYIDQH